MDIRKHIEEMRSNLDEICTATVDDPEWHKLNCVRFVENYRMMRSLELQFLLKA